MKRQDSTPCCLQETYFKSKDTAWKFMDEKIETVFTKQKKAYFSNRMAGYWRPDKIDFKTKYIFLFIFKGHLLILTGHITEEPN